MFLNPYSQDPYQLCVCGSGKKFKFCSCSSETKREIRLKNIYAKYLRNWSGSSDNLRSQGCYVWMASQIKSVSPKRILDIGCGNGNGLISLFAEYPDLEQVVALEELEGCLTEAKRLASQVGIDSEMVTRYNSKTEETFYEYYISRPLGEANSRLFLLQGDPLWDAELEQWLLKQEPFDVITCWLLGSHECKQECKNLKRTEAIADLRNHRQYTHTKLIQLADRILKPNGLIHFVDRVYGKSLSGLEDFCRKDKQSRLVGTSLSIQSITGRLYSENDTSKNRVTMQLSHIGPVTTGLNLPLALSSIVISKAG